MFGLIILLNCITIFDGKSSNECIDNYNATRTVNSTWYYRGCTCKCEMIENKPRVICENCLKLKQNNARVIINPTCTDVYFLDKTITVFCAPSPNYWSERTAITMNTTILPNLDNQYVIGGSTNPQEGTLCAHCRFAHITAPTSIHCYSLMRNKPKFKKFNIKGNLYPIGMSIRLKCEIEPNYAQKYFRNIVILPIMGIVYNRTDGVLNGTNYGSICLRCQFDCTENHLLEIIDICLTPHPNISILPKEIECYFYSTEVSFYCYPIMSDISLEVDSNEIWWESNSKIVIGGKYNKSNRTICIFCYTFLLQDKERCFTILETLPSLYLSPKGNYYPVNKSITLICELKPNGTQKFFNAIKLLSNPKMEDGWNGFLNGTNMGRLCFRCAIYCYLCPVDIPHFDKCFYPHPNYVLEPEELQFYVYFIDINIRCTPINSMINYTDVLMSISSNEVFIKSSYEAIIGGKYNLKNETISVYCYTVSHQFKTRTFEIIDTMPRLTVNFSGYLYPLNETISYSCIIKPNKSAKYFKNIISSKKTDVDLICIICIHDCSSCNPFMKLPSYKRCLRPHPIFTLEPYLLTYYFYTTYTEISCSPPTMDVILNVNTDQFFYISNARILVGGKYNKGNETLIAYCSTSITQYSSYKFVMQKSLPKFTLNLVGNLYPIDSTINILCLLKDNISVPYIKNVTLESYPNIGPKAYLNGSERRTICFYCTHICDKCGSTYTIPKFQKCLKPHYHYFMKPTEIEAYFFTFEIQILCTPDEQHINLNIDANEVYYQSHNTALIGGKYNKSNKTLCLYCFTMIMPFKERCFTMLTNRPKFRLNISGNLYPLGSKIILICDILPNKTRHLIKNILLETEPNIGGSGYMNGTNILAVHFTCSHFCTVCENNTLIPIYNKVLKPHNKYFIEPVKFNGYLSLYLIDIYCSPNDTNINLFIDSKEIFYVSHSRVTVGGIYNYNNRTICAFCFTQIIQYKEKCFHLIEPQIVIKPEYTNIYFANQSMIVICDLFPEKAINQVNKSDFEMSCNNSEIENSSALEYLITGEPLGTICFTCQSLLFNAKSKCYEYFDEGIQIHIEPKDTDIYFRDVRMNIECIVQPEKVVTNNLVQDIDFIFQNSSTVSKTKRLIIFEGKDRYRVCFVCGIENFLNATKCYDYHDDNVLLFIEPSYMKIYLANIFMKITCEATPRYIISRNLIQGIKFIENNSTYNETGLREIIIDGTDLGVICFACGHQLLETAYKCYSYYDKPIAVYVYPNDTDIYLDNEALDIICISTPKEIIEEDKISNIDFIYNSSPFPKISERLIQIDGSDVGEICFECGNGIIKSQRKCYNYYDQPINISIYPLNDIYTFRQKFNISCVVKPYELVSQNKINGIQFTSFNGSLTLVTPLLITLNEDNQGILCFTCGHRMLVNATSCYIDHDLPIELIIEPDGMDFYFKDRVFHVACRLPDNRYINQSLIVGLQMVSNCSYLEEIGFLIFVINGTNYGTICFVCGNHIIANVSKCIKYREEPIEVEILPNDTTIYLLDHIMNISCILKPADLNNAFELRGVGFIFNNSTVDPIFIRLISFDGRDIGNICFSCGNYLFNISTRCYNRYGQKVVLTILPEYKRYYISNISMPVKCLVDPFEVVEKKFIVGIDFIFNNSTFNKIKVREITVFGKNVGTICFICGQTILTPRIRCYQHYDAEIQFSILPDYKVFLPNVPMNIYCGTDPPSNLYYLDKIFFIFANASMSIREDTFIQIDGTDSHTICFRCGISDFKITERCYERYNRRVQLTIQPNYLKIYFQNISVDVQCEVYPVEIIEAMSAIELLADYEFPSRKSSLVIEMPKIDIGLICFTCGNLYIPYVRHCYSFFNKKIEISVQPNYTKIYLDNRALKLSCLTSPIDLIHGNLIGKIVITMVGKPITSADTATAFIFGQDLGRLCYTCGNYIYRSSVRCYDYFEDITLSITPKSEIVVTGNVPIIFTCEVTPSIVITDDLVLGIQFTFVNTTHLKLNEREISILNKEVTLRFCLNCGHILLRNVTKCYILIKMTSFYWIQTFKNIYTINDSLGCRFPEIFRGFVKVKQMFGPDYLNINNIENFSTFTIIGGSYELACFLLPFVSQATLSFKSYENYGNTFILKNYELFYLPTFHCFLPFISNPGSIIRYGHNGYPEDQASYTITVIANNKMYDYKMNSYWKIPYNRKFVSFTIVFKLNFFVDNEIKTMEKKEKIQITFDTEKIVIFTKENYLCAKYLNYDLNNLESLSNNMFRLSEPLMILALPRKSTVFETLIVYIFAINLLTVLSVVTFHKFIKIKQERSIKDCLKLRYLNSSLNNLSLMLIHTNKRSPLYNFYVA